MKHLWASNGRSIYAAQYKWWATRGQPPEQTTRPNHVRSSWLPMATKGQPCGIKVQIPSKSLSNNSSLAAHVMCRAGCQWPPGASLVTQVQISSKSMSNNSSLATGMPASSVDSVACVACIAMLVPM